MQYTIKYENNKHCIYQIDSNKLIASYDTIDEANVRIKELNINIDDSIKHGGTSHDQKDHGGGKRGKGNSGNSGKESKQPTNPRQKAIDNMSKINFDNYTNLSSEYDNDTMEIYSELNSVDSYGRWESRLNDDEVESIGSYTTQDYTFINESLRNDTISQNHSYAVDALDSAINKCKLHDNIVLTRELTGISGTPLYEQLSSLKKGDIYTDKAFMSTSAGHDNMGGADVQFEIYAPKGTKAAYLGYGELSHMPEENEFLLPRNTNLYSHGSEVKTGTLVIKMSVLP